MPKLYPSDIYKEQQFQALNEGVAYGVLRNATDGGECTPQDIIVLKGTPVNVPVCAGIITNSFQTPLSHINILCHNRNIPSAVQTNLWELPQIKANMDEPVRMAVTMNGLSITPCSKAAVDSFIHARPAGRVVALHADLSVNRLVPVSEFDLDWKNTIGNKAAGLGRLNKIAAGFGSDFSIPEGAFAIPFYFFYQHMAAVTIKAAREKLETMQASGAGPEAIRAQLKVLRKTIKEQPLSPALLAAVKAMMQKNGYTSYRFRSSANAEDIAGFSGAGLYDSKTGKTDDAGKPVDMAIKKVWASVYNDNAYFERAAAGIDEHTVMMGILCHRNFPAETANGVAITRNLYRRNFPGYTVNVQVGEVPVVSPPDSVTCEQFVCMKANEVNPLNFDITTDYITYSNITKGQPVLRHKQVKQLYAALASVQKTYASDQALDIEFKFDNNGKLYLKQVRPYR